MGRQKFNKREHIEKTNILLEGKYLRDKGLLTEQTTVPSCYICSGGTVVNQTFTVPFGGGASNWPQNSWVSDIVPFSLNANNTVWNFPVAQANNWDGCGCQFTDINGQTNGGGMGSLAMVMQANASGVPPNSGPTPDSLYWTTDDIPNILCGVNVGTTVTTAYSCFGGQLVTHDFPELAVNVGNQGIVPNAFAYNDLLFQLGVNFGMSSTTGIINSFGQPSTDIEFISPYTVNLNSGVPVATGQIWFTDQAYAQQVCQSGSTNTNTTCDLSCVDLSDPATDAMVAQGGGPNSIQPYDPGATYQPGDVVCHLDPSLGVTNVFMASANSGALIPGGGQYPAPEQNVTAFFWPLTNPNSASNYYWEPGLITPACGGPNNNSAADWWCDPTGAYVSPTGSPCIQSPNQPQSYFTGPSPTEQDCIAQCGTAQEYCCGGGVTGVGQCIQVPVGTCNQQSMGTGYAGGPYIDLQDCNANGCGGGGIDTPCYECVNGVATQVEIIGPNSAWCQGVPTGPQCGTDCTLIPMNPVGGVPSFPLTNDPNMPCTGADGCNDPNCQNYDPNAIGCQGPAGPPDPLNTSCCIGCGGSIPGCMDPSLPNYDPNATLDCLGNPQPAAGYGDTSCCGTVNSGTSCMDLWATKCAGSSGMAIGTQGHFPCPYVNGTFADPNTIVGQQVKHDGSMHPTGDAVYTVDSVSTNTNYPAAWTPNSSLTTLASCVVVPIAPPGPKIDKDRDKLDKDREEMENVKGDVKVLKKSEIEGEGLSEEFIRMKTMWKHKL